MIGKIILHYKIIEKLGQGGMGIVYKARDLNLNRDVALKFLPQQMACQEQDCQRFKVEAQAAAALNHPNIATVFAIEESAAETFIVMEYIEGQELRKIIESQDDQPLPINDIVDYATQIARGLQAAHKKEIIHRDIKSSNIMITPEGLVKIMDFGLALFAQDTPLTAKDLAMGTSAYMSPEQALGEQADQRSDIWSYGVMLYEMTTGQRPFPGKYDEAVLYSVLNENPQPVDSLRADVPKNLTTIINKTLCKNVTARYQNICDLLNDWQTVPASNSAYPLNEPLTEAEPSIAVLPFANMSTDPDQECFCDGLAEEIINELAGLENLHVVARTSSFYFKGEKVDIREIGAKLHVSTVLEGSVRKSSNHIRITAQLIKVADGYHLWCERFDRDLKDTLTIQDEIARTISKHINKTLNKARTLPVFHSSAAPLQAVRQA